MPVTHCITELDRAIRALPVVNADTIRALCEAQPRTCNRDDCTPGGCRKHCGRYAAGVVERLRNQPDQGKKK